MGSPAKAVGRDSIVPFLALKTTDKMEADLTATFDAGNNFNAKLRDTLMGLLGANNERKSEIEALRGDHDQLKKDHDALEVTTTRENDLRKNEIKSLEERQQKDNQARITDIAKLEGKLDTENNARKEEIKALDGWAKGENDARKTEIANLKNFAESENDARKTAIANLDNFAKSENDGRKADIAALNARADAEASARDGEDKALNERISKEISDREAAIAEQQARGDSQNEDRQRDIEDLRTKMMQENKFLKSLAGKTLGVYFNAYRTTPSRAPTATLVVVLTLTLVSSPAPLEAPTCSSSTLQPTTTKRHFCPFARTEKRLPPSSTRTIRTTTRTVWPDRTSSWMSRGEMKSLFMLTLELGWLTSP